MLGTLLEELQLRVILFLEWHEACLAWAALGEETCSNDGGQHEDTRHVQRRRWEAFVSALVASGGHDDDFLADLSILRDAQRYRPAVAAYAELYPAVVKRAFGHRYAPERILEKVFASDDVQLLRLILETHKVVHVDNAKLALAVDKRAARCFALILAESRLAKASFAAPRVRLDRMSRQTIEPSTDPVDFNLFPQNLLWRASRTRDDRISEKVLQHLQDCVADRWAATSPSTSSSSRTSAGASENDLTVRGYDSHMERLRIWAACCGAATGHEQMLRFAGTAQLPDRVSFVAPTSSSSGSAYAFEDTPLAVVASACGQVSALRFLVKSGANVDACTRRGICAIDMVQRHPGDLRRRLVAELRSAGSVFSSGSLHPSRPPSASSAASRPSSASCSGSCIPNPLSAAIERGDLPQIRDLLSRGARLEASDIMAAVRSGDLDVLAFVQGECAAGAASQAEYRQMMRETAAQIRASRRMEAGLPALGAPRGAAPQPPRARSMGSISSSRPTVFRQAGDAVLGRSSALR